MFDFLLNLFHYLENFYLKIDHRESYSYDDYLIFNLSRCLLMIRRDFGSLSLYDQWVTHCLTLTTRWHLCKQEVWGNIGVNGLCLQRGLYNGLCDWRYLLPSTLRLFPMFTRLCTHRQETRHYNYCFSIQATGVRRLGKLYWLA